MTELLFLTWLSHLRRAGMSKPDSPHNPVFSLILPSYPYVSSLPTFSPIFSGTLRVQVRVPQSFLCSPLSLPLLAVPLFFGPGAAFSSAPFADSEQCASVRAEHWWHLPGKITSRRTQKLQSLEHSSLLPSLRVDFLSSNSIWLCEGLLIVWGELLSCQRLQIKECLKKANLKQTRSRFFKEWSHLNSN